MIPVVEKMEIYPVAGHDCMELNLSGAHAPYFTRNIVILTEQLLQLLLKQKIRRSNPWQFLPH